MEMPFTDNLSTIDGTRPERVRHDVVREKAYQQIRKNRVVINFAAFVRGKSGKEIARQLAIFADGFGGALQLHRTANVSAVRRICLAGQVVATCVSRGSEDAAV